MDLFSQFNLSGLELSNRFALSPMTRSRALEGNVPNPLAIIYYEQRASAGLIITEGSQVSPQGVGYIRTPGIHSAEQVEGWKKITDAVHAKHGKIFLQLWHVGRVSHPDFHNGELPVAPSALLAEGEAYTKNGRQKLGIPRALETSELKGIVDQFRLGAENAKAAGFDGVEIHGANGYLLDQFLRDGANQRTDEYGGSVQNRVRLPLEVTKAVISVWGPDRVGYKISPHFDRFSMSDSNPVETYTYFVEELNKLKIAYIHLSEPVGGMMALKEGATKFLPLVREKFSGAIIINGGYDLEKGNEAVASGAVDIVSFGVPFLANPDLVERFRKNAPLNQPDFNTFYAGEEKGYVDYPFFEEVK